METDGPDFNLFLKSLKNPDGSPVWSVAQVNAIPIGEFVSTPAVTSEEGWSDNVPGGGAITVVMVWGWAFLSDYFQTRWLIVMAQAVSCPDGDDLRGPRAEPT